MARLSRICLPGNPQHIIQRDNNRQACFASDGDFSAYAHWLEEYATKYRVAVHAWVFMTNHVHLLATPRTKDGISRLMQALGRRYVRYFNYVYNRTGTLWEGRFKTCVVDEENYLLVCHRYIELNPVRASMVDHPGDYCWSSYKANVQGEVARLWTPHRVCCELGRDMSECSKAYRELFRGHLDQGLLRQIRQATQQGMALGNDKFRVEIERLSGRRARILKLGPKADNKH